MKTLALAVLCAVLASTAASEVGQGRREEEGALLEGVRPRTDARWPWPTHLQRRRGLQDAVPLPGRHLSGLQRLLRGLAHPQELGPDGGALRRWLPDLDRVPGREQHAGGQGGGPRGAGEQRGHAPRALRLQGGDQRHWRHPPAQGRRPHRGLHQARQARPAGRQLRGPDGDSVRLRQGERRLPGHQPAPQVHLAARGLGQGVPRLLRVGRRVPDLPRGQGHQQLPGRQRRPTHRPRRGRLTNPDRTHQLRLPERLHRRLSRGLHQGQPLPGLAVPDDGRQLPLGPFHKAELAAFHGSVPCCAALRWHKSVDNPVTLASPAPRLASS